MTSEHCKNLGTRQVTLQPPDVFYRRPGALDDSRIEFKAPSGHAAKTHAAATEPTRTAHCSQKLDGITTAGWMKDVAS